MKNIHPELVMLDYDRMLGSVDAAMERLYTIVEPMGVSKQQIEDAKKQVEDDGGTFSPLESIMKILSPDEPYVPGSHNKSGIVSSEILAHIVNDYIDAEGPDLMYEDARPFLQRLDDAGQPHMVITYAVDPLWSWMKIRASGYKGDVMMIETSDKGMAIETFKRGEYYQLKDGRQAPKTCLIDDKAPAFKNLESGHTGFCVERPHEKRLLSQQGALLPNVKRVKSLDELDVVNGIVQKKNDT